MGRPNAGPFAFLWVRKARCKRFRSKALVLAVLGPGPQNTNQGEAHGWAGQTPAHSPFVRPES